MKSNSLNYTCLFGGGAIRGASYVGTIKALEELDVNPQTIAGSSVGAIIATLFAIGYNANELREIFLDVNFELFKDLQINFSPRFALSKGEVFLKWIRELIERKFYGDKYKKGKNKAVTFNDINKNLVIITTDLSNFKCHEFSRFETPDYEIATAVRISCAMPGLMKPILYNEKLLVDGDLQKSIPMWKLSKNLSSKDSRVLEFRLEGDSYGKSKNALQFANTIYSCITSISTNAIVETYGNKDKFDYITINTGDILIVDFNCPKSKREELIERGYSQTIEYFTKKLPHKKEILLEKYYTIEKHLKKIKKRITNRQILKAKGVLGELFIDLCSQKETINSDLYNSIIKFKDLFYKNIKYPALFGKVKLFDENTVINQLNKTTEQISAIIYELEEYLIKFPI